MDKLMDIMMGTLPLLILSGGVILWMSLPRRNGLAAMQLKKLASQGREVVVTGASSGLGREFVRQLVKRHGFQHVVVVGRRSAELQATVDEATASGAEVRIVEADLACDAHTTELAMGQALSATTGIVINNAGVGYAGLTWVQEPSRCARLVQLNCSSAAEVQRAALAALVPIGSGVVINVSSLSAYQPLPTHALYAASKAFVSSLSLAAFEECRQTAPGVLVHALEPGTVHDTAFAKTASQTKGHGMTAERVVEDCLLAVDRGDMHCVPGRANWVTACISARLPRWLTLRLAWTRMEKRRHQ